MEQVEQLPIEERRSQLDEERLRIWTEYRQRLEEARFRLWSEYRRKEAAALEVGTEDVRSLLGR